MVDFVCIPVSGRYFTLNRILAHKQGKRMTILSFARNARTFFMISLMIVTLGNHTAADPRNIALGHEIPSEGYCDQPYIIVNNDGSWTCVMTTSNGHEGASSQHVISVRSSDYGESWGSPVDIEPAEGPEASWALPVKTDYGRIYALYTYNADNLREVRADNDYARKRVDTLGAFMMKHSDDMGKSWSSERYEIPMRLMDIDRENPYGGSVLFFWGVGKPIVHRGAVYVGFSKVGRFGEGFIAKSQGCFLKSDNLLTEHDPSRIHWETLPAGDSGLTAPDGPISEETNITGLSDGSLFCTYRTVDGHPCHAYSRDGGRTWSETAYMRYGPGKRLVKHPRAANFVWKTSNGKYLYWFHNHGGRSYDNRNPAWISGGIERDGVIHWSEPEILLYDDNPGNRMSYPDLVEQDGRYFISETQKTTARIHEIDSGLLNGLWGQFDSPAVTSDACGISITESQTVGELSADMPGLARLWQPGKAKRGGFTIECVVKFDSLRPGQILFDSRDDAGNGILLTLDDRKTIRLRLAGKSAGLPGGTGEGLGQVESSWNCDKGLIREGKLQHIAVTVDGGPKVIMFMIDGVLCDGGVVRQAGWTRFHPLLSDVNAAGTARVAPDIDGNMKLFRLHTRPLTVSETVGNYRSYSNSTK